MLDDNQPQESMEEALSVLDPEQGDPMEEAAPEGEDDDAIFGTFFIGKNEFALRAERVREVVPFPQHVTPVPLCSDVVRGVFSLRGEVVPMVDASGKLGLEAELADEERRVAVVSSGDSYLGVVFDRTGEVVRLPEEDVVEMDHEDADGTSIVEGILRLGPGERFVQLLSPTVLGAMGGVPKTCQGAEERMDTRSYSKCIVARVGDYEIAFAIEDVLEIQEELPINSGRSYFHHCRGVVQLRGEVRAIMDFRGVLGMPAAGGSKKLLFLANGDACVGLEVDSLVETLEYPDESLLDLPHLPDSRAAQIGRGVIAAGPDRHLLLADVEGLFERYRIAAGIRAFQKTDVSEEKVDALESEVSYFAFRVGDTTLSFPLEEVSEVCKYPKHVALAESAGGNVCGMMNLRGVIVPLVDIRPEGCTPCAGTDRAVVIVQAGGELRGLIVDSVENIVRGRASQVSKDGLFGARKGQGLRRYIRSTVLVEGPDKKTDMLTVLDPGRLVAHSSEEDVASTDAA